VTIPFIQQLVFSTLQSSGVLKGTKFWTSTNVANGLNAITTCCEMVIFSLFMMWAFPVSEYTDSREPKRSAWKALWDSINFSDFAVESWRSLKFFVGQLRGIPTRRSHMAGKSGSAERTTFSAAFLGLGAKSRGSGTRGIRIPRFHRSHGPMSEKGDSTIMPTKEVWDDSSPVQVDSEGQRWTTLSEETV